MIGLLDTIKGTFSRELIRHIASRLGEAETSVGKAVGGIVPMVLCGLINQAGTGASQAVFALGRQAWLGTHYNLSTTTGVLGVMGSGHAGGGSLARGQETVEMLFGTGSGLLAEPIADFAGVKPESAVVLLNLVGTVLPALLGQHAASRRLLAHDLAAELAAMKAPVRAQLPPGLQGLMGLLWLGGLAGPGRPGATLAHSMTTAVRARVATLVEWSAQWYGMLAAVVGTVVIICFALAGPAAGSEVPVPPAPTKVKLPSGVIAQEMEAESGPRPLETKELGLF